jgi:Transcriptional Coactivator p15 (PC4)
MKHEIFNGANAPTDAACTREPLDLHIATVTKNSREEIRVSLKEYKGTRFLDLRIFVTANDGSEARHPTAKGVAVNPARIDELMDALAQARAEALRLGLLGNGRTA